MFAEYPGPGPTVLLYAHYDVQPAPPRAGTSDPFTPTVRDGRLYGRGAADDKSGIVAHLAALRAHDGKPPVHVKVLIEGSEENGRQKLLEVVDRDPELMRADVMVVADGGNWKLGEPTLCTTLRGHGKLTVTLRTLEGALHSGQFGGAAPDALLALTRLLATLHDDDGNVAVEGLQDGDWDGADLPEADFRRQAGVLDGVAAGRHGQRRRPPVGAPRDLRPRPRRARRRGRRQHRDPARARQDRRARPAGRGPGASMDAVERHLRAHAPWGAQLEIEVEPASTPIALHAPRRRRARAGGRPTASRSRVMGSGGSIPLVAALARGLPGGGDRAVGRAGLRPRRRSTPPTSRSTSTRSTEIALAEALLA